MIVLMAFLFFFLGGLAGYWLGFNIGARVVAIEASKYIEALIEGSKK